MSVNDEHEAEKVTKSNQLTTTDNLKTRFDDLQDFFKARFSDLQNTIYLIVLCFSAVFTVLAAITGIAGIILSLNLNQEKTNLQQTIVEQNRSLEKYKDDLKTEVDKRLGELKVKPKIEIMLLGSKTTFLDEQVIKVSLLEDITKDKLGRERKYKYIRFDFALKNESNVGSGLIYLQLYTNDPLTPVEHRLGKDELIPFRTSDDPDFKYSFMTRFDQQLPGEATMAVNFNFTVLNDFDVKKFSTKYPVLLKVFFGGEKPKQAKFFITFSENVTK